MTATTVKPYRGMGMEGSIARWYEKTTRKDMEEFRKLAARLEAMLPAGGDILEVAPGPGFLAIELAKGGRSHVTAVDASKTFVGIVRRNAEQAGVRLKVLEGNASALPFADNSFDLLVCRAAFKNFSEPRKALEEIRRVLRPGGKGLIIDLRRDTSMTEIRRYVESVDVGVLSKWSMLLTFRFMLLKRAYTRKQLEEMLSGIPFVRKDIELADLGFEVWLQK
jgi:ubiquinone/menaquinone biosynthesis C-methylase UbiE